VWEVSARLDELVAAGPALPSTDWSLADEVLAVAVEAVDAGARTIVECGSGRSTVILGRQLAELRAGSLHSLEHDIAWAEATRDSLATEGLARAEVIPAPLEPHARAAGGGWYARHAVALLPTDIDLLLIDGPPAGEPRLYRSRHPALEEIGPRLAPGATIILDDAERPGEAEAVELWSRAYGLNFVHEQGSRMATARWPV
jgi:predicted O-methyltransferase YrrM